MSRNTPHGLRCAVNRVLALITVVLVIGFGAPLHAHGNVVDDALAHSGVLADEGHDGAHLAVGVHSPSATHCGGGAVCVVALLSAPMLLPAAETGIARFPAVDIAVPLSPTFGFLRPPRRG